MKKRTVVQAVGMFFVVGVFCGTCLAGEDRSAAKRAVPVSRALTALRSGCSSVDVTEKERTADWTWVEAVFRDEDYPLTIDLLARKGRKTEKTIYLLTTSSLNFRSSFFTPEKSALAWYLAEKGYLVVGITPREDNVPLEDDPSVMAEWGIDKHVRDTRKIVELIQNVTDRPYDILGHSFGAVCAAGYAASYSGSLETVILLDLPSFDPVAQPEKLLYAEISCDAYSLLMDSGVYADYAVSQLKGLLMAAALFPDADSGEARSFLGLSGNFTYSGLLHFSLINTAFLPGTITELTGLPQEWPMIQGYANGFYNFAFNPQDDDFGLCVSDISTFIGAASWIGSGIAPLALARDYTAAIAGLPLYELDWSCIDEHVLWLNGELGMGSQTFAADIIRDGGNSDVTVQIITGYGHGDLLFSNTAAEDVWKYIGE